MGQALFQVGNFGTPDGYAVFWAQTGALGSFNNVDTTKWGPPEIRDESPGGAIVVPGMGGGASYQRRVPGSIFGGGSTYRNQGTFIESGPVSVPGSSPQGVVVIRLTRIA